MTESQKAFVTLSVENKDLLPFLLSSFLDFYKLCGNDPKVPNLQGSVSIQFVVLINLIIKF